MNENWMILSWVMLQSECDRSLNPLYEGLSQRYTVAGVEKARYQWMDRDCCAAFKVLQPGAQEHLWDSWRTTDGILAEATSGNLKNICASRNTFNKDIIVKLDLFHCMRRFTRECVSEHHSLYSSFCQFLDHSDLQKLKEACGGSSASTSSEVHYNKGEGAAVPVWIPVRGTSQQEGFHGHQAQWVTGNRVSCELFHAQAMTGVVRWNYQRLVDLKQPDVELPAVFDPRLISELNTISVKVTGRSKYPALQLSNRDTGERFGLQCIEPGCRPVVLNWDKNRAQPNNPAAVAMETEHHFPAPTVVVGTESQESCADPVGAVPNLSSSSRQSSDVVTKSLPPLTQASATQKPEPLIHLTGVLPQSSSPRATRTGPIKTGGLIQVLDHGRWTEPMKAAIDELLVNHRGAKDVLKWVDADYAAMVQRGCTDRNSLLHPTTVQHISRYVKHLAKLKNTSSSLNTSPEKVLETQQLWHSLTS
ncbi:hypothetical protein KUCAC02_001005, partial [Chaenocephalus aceratus]